MSTETEPSNARIRDEQRTEHSLKSTLRFILPHIGLVLLLLLYLTAGAAVFYGIEPSSGSPDNSEWTFSACHLYSLSLLTAVGWGGHHSSTSWGRLFAVFFTLFGIPLLLVTVADIGKFFADFLSSTKRWSRDCMGRAHRSQSSLDSNDEFDGLAPLKAMLSLAIYMAAGAFMYQYIYDLDSYLDAGYSCFMMLSRVELAAIRNLSGPDVADIGLGGVILLEAYLLLGLAIATVCVDLAGVEYIRRIHWLARLFSH